MQPDRDSRLHEIFDRYGRPFYLYDERIIAGQAAALLEGFGQFEFLYSIKTNPFPPVVRSIMSRGFGADAASEREVMLAHLMGVPRDKILYSAPGKTRSDIEGAWGKCVIIADSYNELELLDAVAREKNATARVGLRINPDFSMLGDKGMSGKFGVDEESLAGRSGFLRGLANVEIVGLHVHVRSQVLDEEVLYGYYDRIFRLALRCRDALGWKIGFINFGGGLGVAYSSANDRPLNIPGLGGKCSGLVEKYRELLGARLIIETGRFLVCHAGEYVTPVVDVKESRGVKYLVVRNGLNGFIRPAVAELLHAAAGDALAGFSAEPLFTVRDAFDIRVVGRAGGPAEKVSVVGNLCTAADIVAAGVMLPPAEPGDLIAVSKAGSYAYSLSPLLFSSHPIPLQALVAEDGSLVLE